MAWGRGRGGPAKDGQRDRDTIAFTSLQISSNSAGKLILASQLELTIVFRDCAKCLMDRKVDNSCVVFRFLCDK